MFRKFPKFKTFKQHTISQDSVKIVESKDDNIDNEDMDQFSTKSEYRVGNYSSEQQRANFQQQQNPETNLEQALASDDLGFGDSD